MDRVSPYWLFFVLSSTHLLVNFLDTRVLTMVLIHLRKLYILHVDRFIYHTGHGVVIVV